LYLFSLVGFFALSIGTAAMRRIVSFSATMDPL
jgi:hypothetical protein